MRMADLRAVSLAKGAGGKSSEGHDSAASCDLTTLTSCITAHLKNHHERTTEDCLAVMRRVGANLEDLLDMHFSVDADPTRVSEMLLFHAIFSGQQYLECEHAQLVFGDGGTRAISYPLHKLCALLPLPRFKGLQNRLEAHIELLASLWLPRDTKALLDFLEDCVELLQNMDSLHHVAQELGESVVFAAGTRIEAFHRLCKAIGRAPLNVDLPTKEHARLWRESMTRITAKTVVLMPAISAGSHANARLWALLGRQLNADLSPDTESFIEAILEALSTLLTGHPPPGCMPQLGIDCLRFAGQALTASYANLPREFEDGASARPSRQQDRLRLASIQALAARCIRLVFPDPLRVSSAPSSDDRQSSVAEQAHSPPSPPVPWACMSAALQSVSRWWATCAEGIAASDSTRAASTGGIQSTPRVQATPVVNRSAVSLAKAVAATFVAVLERDYAFSGVDARRSSAAWNGPARSAGETPEGMGKSRGGGGTSGRLGTRRAAHTAHSHAADLPPKLASAITALIAVPCLQLELLRVLRCVLRRFPLSALATLRKTDFLTEGPSEHHAELIAGMHRDGQGIAIGQEDGHERNMAPPPPREPAGKKRRAASNIEDMRVAISDEYATSGGTGSVARRTLGWRESTEVDEGKRRRSHWAPPFSGESIAHEAVGTVLDHARVALEFFEADDDESAKGDRDSVLATRANETQSSNEGMMKLLRHTAAITCALRMLAFLLGAPNPVSHDKIECSRRRDFRRRAAKAIASFSEVKNQHDHDPARSFMNGDSGGVSGAMERLARGFTAAVRAIKHCDPTGSARGRQRGTRTSPITSSLTSTVSAWLWRIVVDCAAELPASLGAPPCVLTQHDKQALERTSPQAPFADAVRLTAHESLKVLLATPSPTLDEVLQDESVHALQPSARERFPVTGTKTRPASAIIPLWTHDMSTMNDGDDIHGSWTSAGATRLNPAITPATPLLLKCFLLMAEHGAVGRASECVSDNLDASDSEPSRDESRPSRCRVDNDDQAAPPGRNRNRTPSRGGHDSAGTAVGAFDGEHGRDASPAEVLLASLKHDGSDVVVQSAVAALPSLFTCSQCSAAKDSCENRRMQHDSTCDWRALWLPALLALLKNGTSEGVRLEMAAGLLRLASSTRRGIPAEGDAMRPRDSRCIPTQAGAAGPDAFTDLLPLWPFLLTDASAVVRAASVRAALAAASAAPLASLKATGATGSAVLETLVDMLSCGDPEVSWEVAGSAGLFVADEGKLVRALYRGGGRAGGEAEQHEEQEDEGSDDTLGPEEQKEREEQEARSREKGLSSFIEAVGVKLQEIGDRLRLGRWQSLHEFTALLRALGSIGCESDPMDDLGRNVYLWTLIRLIDVWVDEGNECGPVAHEQIVRVCQHGHVPLPRLLQLPPVSSASGGAEFRARSSPDHGVRVMGERKSLRKRSAGWVEVDAGSILAPLMEKLMQTGHVEEFVEQALGARDFRRFLEDVVGIILPVFVAGSKDVALEQLAALCDHYQVADARGKDPPQRLLNRHLPHVLTDVLMRGRSAWTNNSSSPGLQLLLKYFPESTPKKLIEGVLPQILEQVSWQLCGPRRDEATVALQAVAHISYQYDATEHEEHDGGEFEESAASQSRGRGNKKNSRRKRPVVAPDEVMMESKVEAVVTQQFLFLMSNVVSKRWSSRTTKDKIRAIQVLGRLVGFLSADEAGSLFSKVMATLQSALSDPHGTPDQRRAAYRVMMGYILGLSDASLTENLSTIVVNVLALIEEAKSDEERPGGIDDPSRDHPVEHARASATMQSTQSRLNLAATEDNELLLKQALAYSRTGVSVSSLGARSIGATERRDARQERGIRVTAAALLRHLIVEKQETMRAHFHKIPFMPQFPDLPALAEVAAALATELGYQSLEEQLDRLTPLLKDESTEVRRAALKHLALVLRRDKQRLAELVLEGNEVEPVVSRLLAGLLELSTGHMYDVLQADVVKQFVAQVVVMSETKGHGKIQHILESDVRIRDLCGVCLGEVGAIDPSRVGFRLREGGVVESGAASGGRQVLLEAAPWELTVEDMSLLLIKEFLVPAFRASTTSMEQDRVAFGIQELLRILADLGTSSVQSKVDRGGASGGGGTSGPMPERLVRRLKDAQVLAVVDPFWRSTYKLSDRAPSSSQPFFSDPSMTVSLERWLSSWCRFLISRSRSPLRRAFEACRGAVRAHAPMAQFLLNHLVADVLAFSDKDASNQVLAEILAVMRWSSSASSPADASSGVDVSYTPPAAPSASSHAAVVRAGRPASATRKAADYALAGTSSTRSAVAQRGSGGRSRFGRDQHQGFAGSKGGGAGTQGGAGGIEHIATQATFRLLDRLGHWAAGRGRRQGGAGAAGGAGWESDAVRRAALLGFARRVPRGVLVAASMRVRAYTRALRYLEEQIRGEHAARRKAAGRSGVSVLARAAAFRNDGANGTLPVLNPAELHQLQAIYRTLTDEPDGMVGLDVMRGAAGVAATLKQRTWQHEHAEDWAGALEVYEQALQERELLNVRSVRSGTDDAPVGSVLPDGGVDAMQARYDQMATSGKTDSPTTKGPASSLVRSQRAIGYTKSVDSLGRSAGAGEGSRLEEMEEDEAAQGFEGNEWEEGEVERGMLHALVELGHLEMLLHQASGMLGVADKQHLSPMLLPVAVEAAWRLQRWPLLQDLLHQYEDGTDRSGASFYDRPDVDVPSSIAADELSGESRYRLALGKVMLRLGQARPGPLASAIDEARADVMAGLGAASMESYQRAYPFLLKLHNLREVEQAFEVMQRTTDDSARREGFLGLGWDERLAAMAASLRQLAPMLAVRRAAFELCSLEDQQVDNWLCLAKRARASRQFAVAGAALRRAGRLGVCQGRLAFEEAKLARDRDGVQRALVLLEPVETDVESLRALVSMAPARGGGTPSRHSGAAASAAAAVLDEDERMQLARKLLLTTEWIVEAGQKHGEAVLARYKLALQLRPGWEKGFFCLGQYIDFLFKSRVEEVQRLASRRGSGGDRGGDKQKGKHQQRGVGSKGWEGDDLAHRLALQTMDNYARSLRYGAKYIFQSMPRLLTLWFQVGFLRDPTAEDGQGGSRSLRSSNAKALAAAGKSKKRHANQAKSAVRKLQSESTKLVKNAVRSIPPYMWYTALPQLTSRVGHPNADVLKVIIEALAMLLKAHPKQALWQLSSLCLSISSAREQVGNEVFEQARRLLMNDGQEDDAVAIQDGRELFAELRTLAEEQPPKDLKEASFRIGHRMDLHRFIVPTQAGLTVSLPKAPRKDTWGSGRGDLRGQSTAKVPESQAEVLAAAAVAAHNPFPGVEMHIKSFNSRVRYMASKAKPKRVSLRTLETGETVYFLCKQERNGDLRKDARLMEFNGMINRLLQKDPAGRARKLRLRTYAVICLNEECGMLEWVQDTIGFRHLVHRATQIKSRHASPVKAPGIAHIKTALDKVQIMASQDGRLSSAVQMYREHILQYQQPCFHLWFVDHFAEPTAWFEARTTFARSAAVWSSVGHVVGLGDRHGENVLIHTKSGECVHVDFDCLFDKGLTLMRPEIVPFRLTPFMVDGMGLCGFEGVYRRVMETCMSVLRTDRETLLSVLEPFLQDPTVGWGRSGRAQRSTTGNGSDDDMSGDVDGGHGGGGAELGRERENEDADRVLRVISERLQGRYNLAVPRSGRRGSADAGSDLPLSVQGQVHRLITEATSQENLCQMYIGWMPWM